MNIIICRFLKHTGTSWFSYFPNNDYKIGSDIFIAKEYSNPLNINDKITNYDYEVCCMKLDMLLV